MLSPFKQIVLLLLLSGLMIRPAQNLAQAPLPSPSGFEEGSSGSGLAAFTLRSGTPAKNYIIEANSGGVCLVDYDNDGFVDIYLVNGGSLERFREGAMSPYSNALFRNQGNRRFIDVTQRAGVPGSGSWGMGCSAGDYDNDGLLDLYVTNYGNNNLYRNRGNGMFEDVTARAGVNDPRWSTGSAWVDFDRDGDLDLFVANYIVLDPQNLPEPGSKQYGSMGTARMGCQYMGLPVMCGPRGLQGAGDSFFVNQGDGTFKEMARTLGMDDPQGYYGLGVLWCDFDNDGYPDLYVANDTTPNQLYRNRGDGSFEEIGLISGAAVSESGLEQAGMGVAAGDYLNQGRFSLYVTNFSEDYNTLYLNEGGSNFTDVTVGSGLSLPSLPYVGWGTFFFDYDNDGWQDIFVANGHVFPQADQLHGTSVAAYRQRNLLFRNLGNGRFVEVGQEMGMKSLEVSRGAAFADLDNDGALDIVVNNLDGHPSLLWNRNTPDHHYLSLKLVGKRSIRSGIGARVRVRVGDQWQMQEVHSGGSYLSQSDLRLHFGLGKAKSAEEVEIRWPDGKMSYLKNVVADQVLPVTQP